MFVTHWLPAHAGDSRIDNGNGKCYNGKKQKGANRMGWKNQVICQLKGYVRAACGEGALFFG